MIPVPLAVMDDYLAILRSREIHVGQFGNYKKWLRYFYDFYANYLNTDNKPEKVRLFLEKLQSKNQTPAQCQQAAHAISLFFEMQALVPPSKTPDLSPSKELNLIAEPLPSPSLSPDTPVPNTPYRSFRQRPSQYCAAGYEETSTSPEWDALLAALAGEIKVRHYSRNTLRTYAHWSRQFQRFLKNKPPAELSTADVKDYLTYLAVLETRVWRAARRAAGEEVALYSDGPLHAGD